MSKVSVGISALLHGIRVNLNEYTYRLFKPGEEVTTAAGLQKTENYWLGIEMLLEKGDTKEKRLIYVGAPLSFSDLLNTLKFDLTKKEYHKLKTLLKIKRKK